MNDRHAAAVMRACVLFACVVLGSSTPAMAQLVVRVENTELAVSGYLRMRGTGEFNFDLTGSTRADRAVTFYDVRSYVTLEIRRRPIGALFSLDLAGDEFNDGAVLGNENPSLLRDFDAKVRHLWIQYDGIFHARLGRQPAQAGQGIVTHIIRDAFRVWKEVGPATFSFNLIKGGESMEAAPGSARPRAVNPPGGEDDDLDAFHFFTNLETGHGSSVRFEVLGQSESSANDRFPEKLYFDLNASGKLGSHLSYAAEFAYMGGRTPDFGQGRLDNRAYLVYLDAAYEWETISPGFRFGLGSGDDDRTDRRQENFQNLFMDETGFLYTNIFADDIHGFDGTAASLANGSGFANVTFFQPRLAVRPLPSLTATGLLTILRATKDRVEGTGPLGNRPATGTRITGDVGTEVDLNVVYNVDRQVTVFGFLGWFRPGLVYGSAADDALKAEVGIAFRF